MGLQFSTVAAGLPLLLHIFGLPSLKPVMRGKKRIKKGGAGEWKGWRGEAPQP